MLSLTGAVRYHQKLLDVTGSTLCVGVAMTCWDINIWMRGPVCGHMASPLELHEACR